MLKGEWITCSKCDTHAKFKKLKKFQRNGGGPGLHGIEKSARILTLIMIERIIRGSKFTRKKWATTSMSGEILGMIGRDPIVSDVN